MSEVDRLEFNNPFSRHDRNNVSEAEPSSSGFSSTMERPSERRSGGGGLNFVSAGLSLAGGGGAISLIARGASALLGGGGVPGRQEQIDDLWAMQSENQMFNMEYMALQQSAQAENRHFTAVSNLLKARHDTAKAAISNIRV